MGSTGQEGGRPLSARQHQTSGYTPRSTSSSALTTGSKLCHYIEDCLDRISAATYQLESAGPDFSVEELDAMLKGVHAELQRVVLRGSSLDEIQLDMIYSEVQVLLDAIDVLDESMKLQLRGQFARLAKQANRLEQQATQAARRTPRFPTGRGSSAALSPVTEEKSALVVKDDAIYKEVEVVKRQCKEVADQMQQKEQAFADRLREFMMQNREAQMFHMSNGFAPARYSSMEGDEIGQADVFMRPRAMTRHGFESQGSQVPITINNNVGVEQSANAQSDQRQESKQEATLKTKVMQMLKQAGSGPFALIAAGVAGAVVREVGGRFLRLSGVTRKAVPMKRHTRELGSLQTQRKFIAKEALRQLHACERAYHETKEHSMKSIRNPFEQPRSMCTPDYSAFEDPE